MKKIIEIYCCDVCEKEVDGKKDLEAIMLPCRDVETDLVDTCSTVELCAKCAGKLRSLIFDNFAKIFINKDGTVHKVELPKVDTTVAAVSTRIIPAAAAAKAAEAAEAAAESTKMISEKCDIEENERINKETEKINKAKAAAAKAAESIRAKEEPTPTKIDDSWGDEVREMLKNGKTVHEIALHYGLNKSTTYNRMNNLGISPKQYRPR